MDLLEAMEARHAIRMYTDEPAGASILAALQAEIDACNAASGLHIQMVAGLDDALLGLNTHYGRFKNVHNAIALIGCANGTDDAASDAAAALEERVGYYGERLALRAVQLGLDTSWVVLDDAASADAPWWTLHEGECAVWFIVFGHGARGGAKHRSKPMNQLCAIEGVADDDVAAADGEAVLAAAPQWFRDGMNAAMLAPTSLSQQPFLFTLHKDGTVSAEALEGLFAHVGLGCAKYHFEIGAGADNFSWR